MPQKQNESAARKTSQKQGSESDPKTPTVQLVSPRRLRSNPQNVRTHSRKQIEQIAGSIRQFGFRSPIIADEDGTILAGNGRLSAANYLELSLVPVFFVCYLRAAERRAYVLADNRLADKGGYDRPRLAAELNELAPLLEQSGLNIELTGWEPAEIDTLFADLVDDERDPADDIVSLGEAAVTRPGETWVLERHRLHCGDARDSASYASLLGRERAAMVFTDGPYNVAVSSIVGRGKTKHREFPSASGEMSEAQYTDFLTNVHTHIARHCADGAIVFTCIDWRHIGQMLTAGAAAFSELKNIVVWVKSNPGQGSFYRSQHEFIAVFKNGSGRACNNVELGRHGRNRSNVWKFAGVNSFRAGRMDELTLHPTVKPIAMVADAMRDCSRRGEIVLDPFLGSGTTILAAEKVGRRGYGIELDPLYVDVAIRRWQNFTRRDAILSGTRKTFREIERARSSETKGRKR